MVLLAPPSLPKRWQFKEKPAFGTLRQTFLTQFTKHDTPIQRSNAQILPDDQREWTAPKGITLCRKGFLIPTQLPENREIVRRLLRDLTHHYEESKFEKQQKKRRGNWNNAAETSNKAPLQCFCSTYPENPEQLLLNSTAGDEASQLNNITDKADWLEAMDKSKKNAHEQKLKRAQSSNYLLVPKFYLLEQLKKRGGVELNDHNTAGSPMAAHLQFNSKRRLVETERRPQVSATNFAIHHLQKTGGAVLVLPVGCGKTVCALYIAMFLRVCTLIVVGTDGLISQWKDRIQEYVPGARIGQIQGPICETENCDFVIACTKSLSERAYNPEKLRKIGLVIFDEAHHAAAPTFLTAVVQVAAPYMLALTQDPTRQDGMTNVLYYYFSYNVFIVRPSLPPDINLHIGVHRFAKRCFIQDADCVSSTRLKERKQNAAGDPSTLQYCESLASFDKKHYAAACLASAPVALLASRQSAQVSPSSLPAVAGYHAASSWQNAYSTTDVTNLTYTQIYQSLQSDAHRNATAVAYMKQFLKTNDANAIRMPTVEECNSTSELDIFERHRSHVNVRIAPVNTTQNASTSLGVVKLLHQCSREELQTMQQLERQILVLASEKEHIDSLYDRMIRSGFPESMIGVYVGGENKKLSTDERNELLARRIILATFAMAAEGTDIATLNTIFFMAPRSGITDQAIGRGLRDKLTKEIMPYVMDFTDSWCEMTKNMYYSRHKSYKFYDAIHHFFDDDSSYEAIGAVCWKKPLKTRTQRLVEQRKESRKRKMTKNKNQKKAKIPKLYSKPVSDDDATETTINDEDTIEEDDDEKTIEEDDEQTIEDDDEKTIEDDAIEESFSKDATEIQKFVNVIEQTEMRKRKFVNADEDDEDTIEDTDIILPKKRKQMVGKEEKEEDDEDEDSERSEEEEYV